MSKKNDRRKRALEKEKTTAKAAIITLAVAAVFLVLGIVGLIQNSSRLREYENAEDTRRVEATVTDTKLKNDQAGEREWYTRVKYEVDGEEYRGAITLYKNSVKVGDTVKVEVYQRPNGKYVIPEITDTGELTSKNIVNYIALAAGAVLLAAAVTVLVSSARKIREVQAKIQSAEKE